MAGRISATNARMFDVDACSCPLFRPGSLSGLRFVANTCLHCNPGSIEFYAEFMREIFEGLKGRVVVWGVSHAGHVAPPKPMQIPNVEGQRPSRHCTRARVRSATSSPSSSSTFRAERRSSWSDTPSGVTWSSRYSRGPQTSAWSRRSCCFPAIESLDSCPRVSIINPLVTYLRPLTVASLSALRFLPRTVQNMLIRFYIYLATACTTPHRTSLSGAQNYFRPECLMACFVFTRDIIQNVRERDDATIGRHADKLVVYYGQNDHWSPVEYYDDLRRTFPEADVRLCDRGFRHAFVLDCSVDVGDMVRGWIEPLLPS
ncbi:hypothetical protein MTO96_019304 [Rhipicephalus appendiculatus]